MQHAGTRRVTGGHQDSGLVVATGRQQFPAYHEESCGVVGAVFDIRDQRIQAVNIGSGLSADRCSTLLVARPSCPCRVAAHANQIHMRQVLPQPAPALGYRLLVCAYALDVFQGLHTAEQMLLNFQFYLAADFQW